VNGAPETTTHDTDFAKYEYDVRDLVSKVTNAETATDPAPKVTTFTYTDKGERLRQTKPNGNTVDHTYFLDGLLKTQVEKKSNGTVVSEHTYSYDPNGNKAQDIAKTMNADNNTAYLNTTSAYTYDPRDRIASLTKTGTGAGTETYVHDANNNVISQTVGSETRTFNYDRNRLLTSQVGPWVGGYNYDPYGRLKAADLFGIVLERKTYDGFDHVIEHQTKNGDLWSTTKYSYDPLDRTATKTSDLGTPKQKTTTFNYLGLSNEVLDEKEDVAGQVTKSYQYSPWGERLSQVKHNTDGTEEDSYYGYNSHTDVETLTDQTGNTTATYGYTAYGNNDNTRFTGVDKPDAADPTKEPYNPYRFNAKRWDQASSSYDMGFRDYSPGLNRFITRDTYNGALADLNLGTNPYTNNRYAFAAGNPITNIELDGHIADDPDLQDASLHASAGTYAVAAAMREIQRDLAVEEDDGGGGFLGGFLGHLAGAVDSLTMCHSTAFVMDPEGCAEDMGEDAQAFAGLITSFREDPLGTAYSVVTGGCPDEEGLSAEFGCFTAHVLSIAIVRKASSARATVAPNTAAGLGAIHSGRRASWLARTSRGLRAGPRHRVVGRSACMRPSGPSLVGRVVLRSIRR
jgi:RHS repeat-associated protein